jgi:hypothetical protein
VIGRESFNLLFVTHVSLCVVAFSRSKTPYGTGSKPTQHLKRASWRKSQRYCYPCVVSMPCDADSPSLSSLSIQDCHDEIAELERVVAEVLLPKVSKAGGEGQCTVMRNIDSRLRTTAVRSSRCGWCARYLL